MGGNAFKEVRTVRLVAEDYFKVTAFITATLETAKKSGTLPPDFKYSIIKAYENKPNFGDIDVIYSTEDTTVDVVKIIAWILNVRHSINNGDVVSLALPLVDSIGCTGYFQLDLIKTSKLEWAEHYFSFNDLGNLMGRIARSLDFVYGHDGLWYKYNGKKVLVTDDVVDAFGFLGFDYNEYCKGFKELEDIFRYIVKSEYFIPECFYLENRNHQGRSRDKKRPTYTTFINWLRSDAYRDAERYDFAGEKFYKALRRFGAFRQTLNKIQREEEIEGVVKLKFNGRKIIDITGITEGHLIGKIKGEYSAHIKELYGDFRAYIYETPEEQITASFKSWWENL